MAFSPKAQAQRYHALGAAVSEHRQYMERIARGYAETDV
jgi:hypothetical protein